MLNENANKAYTLQERAGKPGGGKGALITEDKCGCLSTSCGGDRCVFQPFTVDGSQITDPKHGEACRGGIATL